MQQLENIACQLQQHKPRQILWRQRMTRAAVAMVLAERPVQSSAPQHSTTELCVLMIRRAEHPQDPWSGHMAFPGGRMEKHDQYTMRTAIRETAEEIGLNLSLDDCLAPLSDVITRRHDKLRPMVVSPWVFQQPGLCSADAVAQNDEWQINYEVDEVVWIPLSFFANSNNREVMTWRKLGITMKLPCYFYEGRRVWGLSLMMINELVRICQP